MKLAGQGTGPICRENGYAMAALLVGLSVMSVLMGMALPVWTHMVKREKEEELIWRGEQYKRAIGLFQRKFANTFPPTVDVLVEQRFLRKKYKDPITNDDFQLLPAGGGVPAPAQGQGQPAGGRQGAAGQTVVTGRTTTGPGGSTFQMQTQGQGPTGGMPNIGIGGVVSKSKDSSIKIYNGRQKYNEWAFVYIQTAQRIGAPGGSPFPGQPMQPGMPGMPGGRGGPPGMGGRDGRGGFPPGGFPGRGGMPPIMPSGRPPVPFPGQPGQQPFPFGAPQPGNPQQRPPQRPPG